MKLIDFVNTDAIVPELVAEDRNGVIRELVNALAKQGVIDADRADGVAQAVIYRENQGSIFRTFFAS